MMEKYFCDYNQSLALKEIGFQEPCLYYFFPDSTIGSGKGWINWNESKVLYSRPLKSQVFEWFRKQHKLKGFVEPVEYLDDTPETYMWVVYNECHSGAEQLTYEEAESACIDKLIEILQHDK